LASFTPGLAVCYGFVGPKNDLLPQIRTLPVQLVYRFDHEFAAFVEVPIALVIDLFEVKTERLPGHFRKE
jgi:hypothetical protein